MIVDMMRKSTGGHRWYSFLDLFPVATAREVDEADGCRSCPLSYTGHPVVYPSGELLCLLDFKLKVLPSLDFEDMM